MHACRQLMKGNIKKGEIFSRQILEKPGIKPGAAEREASMLSTVLCGPLNWFYLFDLLDASFNDAGVAAIVGVDSDSSQLFELKNFLTRRQQLRLPWNKKRVLTHENRFSLEANFFLPYIYLNMGHSRPLFDLFCTVKLFTTSITADFSSIVNHFRVIRGLLCPGLS